MNVLETMPRNVEVVREWWDNLSEDEKDTTAVYMVIGDMEGECNCDFLAGRGEDIMYTLAQSMANDRDFYEIAKAAVELIDKYNAYQLEELKSCVKETTSKVVS